VIVDVEVARLRRCKRSDISDQEERKRLHRVHRQRRVRGEEEEGSNTEFAEIGTQRAQRLDKRRKAWAFDCESPPFAEKREGWGTLKVISEVTQEGEPKNTVKSDCATEFAEKRQERIDCIIGGV
jgi:hypothetical protein